MSTARLRHACALGLVLLAGCAAPAAEAPDAAALDAVVLRDAGPPITLGTTGRPARIVLPPADDGTAVLPVGYGASAVAQDLFFQLSGVAHERLALRAQGPSALTPRAPGWATLPRDVRDHLPRPEP